MPLFSYSAQQEGMEMIGIGVDIVDVRRFARVESFSRVCEYILTQSERQTMAVSRDPVQFVASRFAAKEAIIKAYPHALTLQDIDIEKNGEKPAPMIRHASSGKYATLLSLTHGEDHAVAVACVSRLA